MVQLQTTFLKPRGVPPKAPPSFVLDAPDSGTSAPHWAPSLPSTRSTPLKSCQLPHVCFQPWFLAISWTLAYLAPSSPNFSKCDCLPFHALLNRLLCGFCGSPAKTRSQSPTASLPAFLVNFLGHTIQSPQPTKQCCPHPWWSSPP